MHYNFIFSCPACHCFGSKSLLFIKQNPNQTLKRFDLGVFFVKILTEEICLKRQTVLATNRTVTTYCKKLFYFNCKKGKYLV